MQVAHALSEAGHVPDSVETQAKVQIRNIDGNPTISQIDLVTRGARAGPRRCDVPGDRPRRAKDGCIISRALAGVGTSRRALES